MKLLCFERDNVTYACPTSTKSHVYSASFEFYPFHEGATFALYKGVYTGAGARNGQFCVVRAHLDTRSTEEDWKLYLSRAVEARRLAAEFNKCLGHTAIVFEEPLLTAIDSLSDFSSIFRVFKPHDKRLKPKEYVVVEPFLEGDFRKENVSIIMPSNQTPPRPATKHGGDKKSKSRKDHSQQHQQLKDLANAFSHFTWLATNHKLVVSGIQGVFDSDLSLFRFCNPIIHSTDRVFGETDGASDGIRDFLTAHRCSNTCTAFKSHAGLGRDLNLYQPQTCDKLAMVIQS